MCKIQHTVESKSAVDRRARLRLTAITNSLFFFFLAVSARGRARGSCIKYYTYGPMHKILSVYNSSTVTPISSYLFVRQGGREKERKRERHYLLHFHRGRKLIVARYIYARVCTQRRPDMQPDGLCSVHLESSPRQRFSWVNRGNVRPILVGSTKRARVYVKEASERRRTDDLHASSFGSATNRDANALEISLIT